MKAIEIAYKQFINHILDEGAYKEGRNGLTKEVIGLSFNMDLSTGIMPLITGRQMYPKGIIGEWIAFLRNYDNIEQFESVGCNYWKTWADEDGNLTIDYPPRYQLDHVINNLIDEPNTRKAVISLWNPDNLDNLSLECCHTQYQFIRNGGKLDMIWTQRSVDVMIGMPSDMVLAALYLKYVSMKTGFEIGKVRMNFGSCHIYDEHIVEAEEYLNRPIFNMPTFSMNNKPRYELAPADTTIYDYLSGDPIKFLLKA